MPREGLWLQTFNVHHHGGGGGSCALSHTVKKGFSTAFSSLLLLLLLLNICLSSDGGHVSTVSLIHNMQAMNRPNNQSSCSQCNLAANLCNGERAGASTLNEELRNREFRGEREKSAALYNITCLAEIFNSLPNVQPLQPITQKGACFNTTNRAP